MCREVLAFEWIERVLSSGVAALVGALVFALLARAWLRSLADAPWPERARACWPFAQASLIVFSALGPIAIASSFTRCPLPLPRLAAFGVAAVALAPALFALRLVPSARVRPARTAAQRAQGARFLAAYLGGILAALTLPMLLADWLPPAWALPLGALVVVLAAGWQLRSARTPPRSTPDPRWNDALARAAARLGVEPPEGGVVASGLPAALVSGRARVDATEGLMEMCEGDALALEGAAMVGLRRAARRRWPSVLWALSTVAPGAGWIVARALGWDAGWVGAGAWFVIMLAFVLSAAHGEDIKSALLADPALALPIARYELHWSEYLGRPLALGPGESLHEKLAKLGAPAPFERATPPTWGPASVAFVAAMLAQVVTIRALFALGLY